MDSTSSLPMSPWADRFPDPKLTIIEGGTKHSLLAPQYPALKDPRHYANYPDPNVRDAPSNYKDIDRVLWSEAVQKQYLKGIRVYQLTVLNRYLMFPTNNGFRLLGGPRKLDFEVFEQEKINVDENTWLPFLRKDRWFDWINFSLFNSTQPALTWSVDDQELWSRLSVTIELANRILQALLEDKHDGGMKDPPYLH